MILIFLGMLLAQQEVPASQTAPLPEPTGQPSGRDQTGQAAPNVTIQGNTQITARQDRVVTSIAIGQDGEAHSWTGSVIGDVRVGADLTIDIGPGAVTTAAIGQSAKASTVTGTIPFLLDPCPGSLSCEGQMSVIDCSGNRAKLPDCLARNKVGNAQGRLQPAGAPVVSTSSARTQRPQYQDSPSATAIREAIGDKTGN